MRLGPTYRTYVADKSRVLQAWGVSEKGSVRPTNEDRFAIDEALRLCVVADGMGGHNAGEIAARRPPSTPCSTSSRDRPALGWPFGFDPSLSEAGNLIRTAIHLANMQSPRSGRQLERLSRAWGPRIVAALVVDGRLSVGHVGDSRLYRLAGRPAAPADG